MDDQHIVSSFDRDLSELNTMIAKLGGLAEQQLAASIDAFEARNAGPLQDIIDRDKELDALEFQLNERAVEIIATRSPLAKDLRRIITAVKIASVLERVGDYAKNIAKRTRIIIDSENNNTSGVSVRRMATTVLQMLNQVLDAYATGNATLAMDVWDRDHEVDQMHTALFNELLAVISDQAEDAIVSSHFLFIAKNLERIGDHTTNISEQVYFLEHGQFPNDDRPKADTTSLADTD